MCSIPCLCGRFGNLVTVCRRASKYGNLWRVDPADWLAYLSRSAKGRQMNLRSRKRRAETLGLPKRQYVGNAVFLNRIVEKTVVALVHNNVTENAALAQTHRVPSRLSGQQGEPMCPKNAR